MSGWYAQDCARWDRTRQRLLAHGPLDEEDARNDLLCRESLTRLWIATDGKQGERWLGRGAFARRWGWTEREVRTLISRDDWHDAANPVSAAALASTVARAQTMDIAGSAPGQRRVSAGSAPGHRPDARINVHKDHKITRSQLRQILRRLTPRRPPLQPSPAHRRPHRRSPRGHRRPPSPSREPARGTPRRSPCGPGCTGRRSPGSPRTPGFSAAGTLTRRGSSSGLPRSTSDPRRPRNASPTASPRWTPGSGPTSPGWPRGRPGRPGSPRPRGSSPGTCRGGSRRTRTARRPRGRRRSLQRRSRAPSGFLTDTETRKT